MAKKVEVIVSAKDNATKTIKNFTKNTKMSFTELNQSLEIVRKGVDGIVKAFDILSQGAKLKQQERAFDNLARTYNTSSNQIIKDLERVSKGFVDQATIIEKAGTAMLTGIDPKYLTDLMEIAVATSKVTGQEVTKAFDDISLAVARQSKMILDNLGIVISVEEANTNYAKKLGKTAEQLTDVERKQAFLNEVMEKGGKMVKDIGKDHDVAYTAVNQFRTAAINTWNELTQLLATALTPELIKVNQEFSTWIENNEDILKQDIKKYIEGIVGSIKTLMDIYKGLPEGTLEYGIIAALLFGKKVGVIVGILEYFDAGIGAMKRNIEDLILLYENFMKRLKKGEQTWQSSGKIGPDTPGYNEYKGITKKFYIDPVTGAAIPYININPNPPKPNSGAVKKPSGMYGTDTYDLDYGKDKAPFFKDANAYARQLNGLEKWYLAQGQVNEELEKTKELIKNSMDDAEESTRDYIEVVESMSQRMSDAFADVVMGFTSIEDGFRRMIHAMISELARAKMMEGFMGLLNMAIGAVGSYFGTPGATDVGGSTSIGTGAPATMAQRGWTGANGGLLTGGFQAFANGGMATSPTLGLIGEGRYNEAIVPLPDGKSIPVDMKGGGKNINISNTFNFSGGQGNEQDQRRMGNMIAGQIKEQVRMAIKDEKRFGGVLNRQYQGA